MSYHWLAKDGKTIIKYGTRSMMPEELKNGKTARVAIVVDYPKNSENYILRLTLVQEGCVWFYISNPESALDVDNRWKM